MLEMLIAVATCSCSNVLVWRRWQAAMRGLGFDQSHNLPEIVNRYAAKTHKNEVGLALAYHALSVLAYHVAFTLYARPPRRFLACDARGRQEAWLLSRVSARHCHAPPFVPCSSALLLLRSLALPGVGEWPGKACMWQASLGLLPAGADEDLALVLLLVLSCHSCRLACLAAQRARVRGNDVARAGAHAAVRKAGQRTRLLQGHDRCAW